MNQILYTGGKNKKSKMTDMQKIILFFVVFIIIFAICIISLATNSLNKLKASENNTTNTVPETPVASVIKIGFESQLGAIKVTVTSDKKIESISYWWDEESPTLLQPDDVKYETIIQSRQGTHKLNIEVVDENGNKKTEQKTVIGDAGPELTISTDSINNYVINVKDDEEVDKIIIKLNDKIEEIEVNKKEFEYKLPIPKGDSLIDVTAYNLNGLSTNRKAKITGFGE